MVLICPNDDDLHLDPHFQGEIKVTPNYLHGSSYFLLQIHVLRAKISIVCSKTYFLKMCSCPARGRRNMTTLPGKCTLFLQFFWQVRKQILFYRICLPLPEDVDLDRRQRIWMQVYAVPPHYAVLVKEFISEQYPIRWVGRGGSIAWLSRSLDITSPDFCLWDIRKMSSMNSSVLRQGVVLFSTIIHFF